MYIRVIDSDGDMYYLTNQDLECIAIDLGIDDDNVEKWYKSINEDNWLQKLSEYYYNMYKQWKGQAYLDDKPFYKEVQEKKKIYLVSFQGVNLTACESLDEAEEIQGQLDLLFGNQNLNIESVVIDEDFDEIEKIARMYSKALTNNI